jgi:CO/xanthine dehydrogenase FAD-binding subunit
MDLPNIDVYLRPLNLQAVENWEQGWAWLAGGTWIFSQLDRDLKVLVDLEQLGWSEIEVRQEGLAIGATCTMASLRQWGWPENWTSVKALLSAVDELASFKVTNMATVGGNLCLALPASTFAPVMVALGASYEILSPVSPPRFVPAKDFQTGPQQTILQPGEVLRKIWIPQQNLEWQVSFKRFCVATAGYAISIVVGAYNPKTGFVRFGIGASVPAPTQIEFAAVPSSTELVEALLKQLPVECFLEDERASAAYRQHITKVLMQRSLEELLCQNP